MNKAKVEETAKALAARIYLALQAKENIAEELDKLLKEMDKEIRKARKELNKGLSRK